MTGRYAVGLLGLLLLAGCKQELYTGLDEREANEIVSTLTRVGIGAERAKSDAAGYQINVEPSDFAAATETLLARGLPREKFQTIGDVFQEKGLINTPLAERARLVFAIDQELSSTISQIDGVISARVHVVLPDTDPMKRNAPPSSASVMVRHVRGAPVAMLAPQIRRLVASSVEGLNYDNVTVTLFEAEPLQSSPRRLGTG